MGSSCVRRQATHEDQEALYNACSSGDARAVASLLSKAYFIHPGAYYCTRDSPFLLAVKGGHASVVYLLIQEGVDVNAIDHAGNSALCYACLMQHEHVVRALASVSGLDCNYINRLDHPTDNALLGSPLSLATRVGNMQIVEMLLSVNADPNSPDLHGDYPIHAASRCGHGDILAALVQVGARVDVVNELGHTPMFVACTHNHANIVGILLRAGASVHIPERHSGELPLHVASEKGNAGVVRQLLRAGADVDARDNRSRTPLDRAARTEHDKVVRLLLRWGAHLDPVPLYDWDGIYEIGVNT